MELVTTLLDEAELTPDWDLQTIREKIGRVSHYQSELTNFEHLRFMKLCERFRTLIRYSIRGREEE